MKFDLAETIALLHRTPSTLNSLLRGLPESWTHSNEGPNTWSTFDVVGHLIHGERTDWIPRARIILSDREDRSFEPFDRFAQAKLNQGKSLAELLDEFAQLRQESLSALRAMNLQPKDLERKARHPALGVVTLSELLASWPVHDLTHLHQISRVMAVQYREAVGPWTAFMGAMQCNGHSA